MKKQLCALLLACSISTAISADTAKDSPNVPLSQSKFAQYVTQLHSATVFNVVGSLFLTQTVIYALDNKMHSLHMPADLRLAISLALRTGIGIFYIYWANQKMNAAQDLLAITPQDKVSPESLSASFSSSSIS
jgi:hypothetical protein